MDGAGGSPPFEYLEMCYRRIFHLTPQEFDRMSYKTFLLDLEMLNIEKSMKNYATKNRKYSS